MPGFVRTAARRLCVVPLALVAACAASASDYEGTEHLKQDSWERLNVLATTLNERCVSEDLLGRLIEARFSAARTTPVIAFRSQFEDEDGAFESDRWYEHIQDQLYLDIAMGCMAEVEDWGIIVGHIVHVEASFFAFEPRSGSFRSWGHAWRVFGDAGVLEIGVVPRDYLTVVVGSALDDYLQANLGSPQAVLEYRGEYPREAEITKIAGPFGAKAKAGTDANHDYGTHDSKLLRAAENGNTILINALIDAGANVNAKNENGATALYVAAWNGHARVIQALAAAGADVNAKSNAGFAALHWAAWNGHTDVVEALISAGADIGTKDSEGRTALELARKGGHAETLAVLETTAR